MNAIDRQRITPEHLGQQAIVYVRQSSPDQVRSNVESTRVQLGLRERAIAFGWSQPVVIDDDLGISAAGFTERPGFQHMLALVVTRQVGIIFCIDASRLSRNSKDWASLFELCGHFQTLVADLDQVYDLAIPNDRLVLGIKGTISELELSILRNRLRTGAELKAARGELKFILPPGYAHDADSRITLDPDKRVQSALHYLFDQFEHCSSIRQLALGYRDTGTLFPVRKLGKGCSSTLWKVPSPFTLRHLLLHPIYAGVYAYGRSRQRVHYINGSLVKKTQADLPEAEWRVCIHNHHPPYISWERHLANQSKIVASRPRWTMEDNLGPLRDGLALLSGLLRCGHCGKKVRVAYKSAPVTAMYYCDGKIQNEGGTRCLAFGSKLVDETVGTELCKALSPHSIEAAELAQKRRGHEHAQAIEQARLQVQAAEYETSRAFEQYDLVDPKNRLVADTLEERLNEKLADLQAARHRLAEMMAGEEELSDEKRQRLHELGENFTNVWNHPRADASLKKRLLRAAIFEIVVRHVPEEQRLELTLHWQGGAHTQLHVKKRVTPVGCKTDPSLVEMVRELASLSDAEIARILNMKRITTARGQRWTQDRVLSFRRSHRIKAPASFEEDQQYLTGKQVAERLNISRNGVLGLLRIGALHNHQPTDFAPWRIAPCEVVSPEVRKLVEELKRTGRLPRQGGCPNAQLSLTIEKNEKVGKGAL